MDPITILGAFASIIEIVHFLERTSQPSSVTAEAIERVFDSRAADTSTPEHELQISRDQLRKQIARVLSLRQTSSKFLDRISAKCLPPYYAAINDPNSLNAKVDEAYELARKCVCENIRFARRHNSGQFPNDEFRELWDEFNCS